MSLFQTKKQSGSNKSFKSKGKFNMENEND